MAGTSSPSISGPRDILDAKAYAALEHHFVQENVKALENTVFFHTPEEEDQHLDIGCGPGTFTKNYLVPFFRPCKRLVAIDKSPLMIDFAVLNSCHENITYDVFDFGGQSVEELLAKYGAFDRIYSFICFHYVKNQRKAYRDLAQLLTPGSGECLIVASVSSSLTDAWRQMHVMDRWREFVPVCEVKGTYHELTFGLAAYDITYDMALAPCPDMGIKRNFKRLEYFRKMNIYLSALNPTNTFNKSECPMSPCSNIHYISRNSVT